MANLRLQRLVFWLCVVGSIGVYGYPTVVRVLNTQSSSVQAGAVNEGCIKPPEKARRCGKQSPACKKTAQKKECPNQH